MKGILVFILFIATTFPGTLIAQNEGAPVDESKTDTFYFKVLPELDVYAPPTFKSKRDARRYYKLIRDVRKTLPYAKLAAELLVAVNDTLQTIPGELAKKKFMKSKEKDLMAEFEQPLRRLTFSQGRLLMKLVDRECQQTSYEIVKLYRGRFSAFFWQSVAFFFGANLKSEYDALGDDRMIEYVVRAFEQGRLMM